MKQVESNFKKSESQMQQLKFHRHLKQVIHWYS